MTGKPCSNRIERRSRPRWRARGSGMVALLVAAALTLAGCGSGDDDSDGGAPAPSDGNSLAGQEITVLLPYKVPKGLLQQFTDETGIKVDFQVNGWDALQEKLVVAMTAETFIADVTEMDWSWVGQFGASGWYTPLDDLVSQEVQDDLAGTGKFFTYDNQLYATCYSNDLRISLYNKAQFADAGISEFPATISELESTLDQLKSAGVAEYPMTMALSSTEGGVVPWYLLTLALGGQLFDDSNQPVFGESGSTAHQALEFEIKALQEGWIPAGAVTSDDGPAFERFLGGAASIALAAGPGNLVAANDKSQSGIAPDAAAALVPGVDGPGQTFGLQEGLGIPESSEHKEAAAAFIDWWQQTDTQVEMYKQGGFLPCGASGLQALTDSGDLQGGKIFTEAVDHLIPLFPNGAPPWYPAFSSKAQGLINAAVKGDKSVDDALSELQTATEELANGG
jgi:multiple sugar transport system substrate-binding protein